MPASDNGNADSSGDRPGVSPHSTVAGRSASPAKRSAADMEETAGAQKHVPSTGSFGDQQEQLQNVAGSDAYDKEQAQAGSDVAMAGMTPASRSIETQETANSFAVSDGGAMSVDTQATSVQQDEESKNASGQEAEKGPYSTEQTDEQVRHVMALRNKTLDEGDRGVVISTKWLSRVMARTSDNLKSGEFPKEAREGNVGPLDNSDIVPEGAFQAPYLTDPFAKEDFIPLKPGLTLGQELEVLPLEAHDYILTAYGSKHNKPIIRYAHNTADAEATQSNVQYELHPPVITVRKVPQSLQPEEAPKNSSALKALKAKQELRTRGQRTPEDAVKLVSSRGEKFQKFLTRAKEAAGVPLTTKVKIWRLPDPVIVDKPNNQQVGVLSPPASRDSSPAKTGNASNPTLVIDQATFAKMERGRDFESVDGKDQSQNDKYNGNMTMAVAGFFQDGTMLLEEQMGGPGGGEFQSDLKKGAKSFLGKKAAGSKPSSATPSRHTSPAPGGVVTRGRLRKDGRTRGTVGLMNLGNTCYMNSALQCIRSVEELALYFLSNKYKPEINNDNPLGHHGSMANAYAGVLQGIYDQSSGGAFTPSHFKKTLGQLQPLFSGYGQQDSQEFLSFLVDALHEDLNRIHKKPYIENPDSEDDKVRDPEYILELGQTYRDNHAKRNASVAMDLFSGFYKNTMECPACDKVSVTFDPYSLLTVQLPMDHAFQHIVTFVPLRGKPIIHQIDMDKNSSIKTLKEHIAKKHPGVEANRLWMAEVYNHKVYKVFEDSTTLGEASIQTNDHLFMYELDAIPTNPPSGKKTYTLYSSAKEEQPPIEGMDSPKADVFTVPIFNRTVGRNDKHDVDLHPLYITVTRDEAKNYEVILKKVLMAVQNITSRPILREFQDSAGPTSSVEEVDDTDKEPNGNEDTAGISDHSTQSEDGYVNVSLDKHAGLETDANGTSPMQVDDADDQIVPSNFMNPQYFLSPALRNQLFDVKYGESGDGAMHFTGMSSIKESSLKTMQDRVKAPARRSSVQSSNSEESATSTGNSEDNESDADDADKPDIVLGEATANAEESDNEENGILQPSVQEPNQPRGGRRKKQGKGRKSKKKGRGPITYSKKDQTRFGQNQNQNQNRNGHGHGHGVGFKSTTQQQSDSTYYIQIGECIALDWTPEAWDALFGGKPNSDDMRGHLYVDSEGKNGEVFHDEELELRKKKRDERKKHGLDLEDCFVETGKREVLSEDNAWYCNRCKELRRATKTLELWTLPDILVVHLKRFGGNRSFRDKIDVLVDYPVEGLDMNDKVGFKDADKDYTYDLFAVDNHYGGLGGGHYTAIAKNFYDGEWYDYNDSITHKITGTPPTSAAAYLLFYRRRSDKPLGPTYLQEIVDDFRNPPAESAADDAADDESGEGRLGGPVDSSQHGSSSALSGAGVAANSMTNNGGSGGTGAAGRLLTQGPMTNDNERMYGGAGNDSWNFDTVDETDGAGNLLNTIEDHDDANSIDVQYDHDNDSGFEDYTTGQNTPAGYDGYNDNEDINHHHIESYAEAPSLEQATDIHLSDAPTVDGDSPQHGKMD